MNEGCPELVADHTGFHFHKCSRPVKRDGLCGVHARVKERREAARLQRSNDLIREQEATKARREEAPVLATRLMRHGISVKVWGDGTVVIPAPQEIADMLDATYPI